MQPSGAGKTRLVSGLQETSRILKNRLGVFLGEMLKKPLRAGPGPSLKQSLEMERAEVNVRRDLVERRPTEIVRIEKAQGAFDPRVVHRRLRKRLGAAPDGGFWRRGFHNWQDTTPAIAGRRPVSC